MNAHLQQTFAAMTETLRSIRRAIHVPVLADLDRKYHASIRLHLPPMVTLETKLSDALEIVETRLKLERVRGERQHWSYDANRLIALRQLLNAINFKIAEFS